MRENIRIAGVQMNVEIAETEQNLVKIFEAMKTAAGEGADLAVFPECALTGYCFQDLQEARAYAQLVPGPFTERLEKKCQEFNIHIIVGMLEYEGDQVYNTAAFIAPNGVVGHYRKIHLPYLGIDRFLTPGDRPFEVYDSEVGQVGLNICYDAAFPESGRVMMLHDAELIALPTNWPVGAECNTDFVINTRAFENRVNYIAVNRVGEERGTNFIGQSKIVDFTGRTLAVGAGSREEIIYADLDLSGAREKHIVNQKSVYELDRLKDRRVEFYSPIIESEKT